MMGKPAAQATEIGLISDTHGLLRPEAVKALAGVSLILHAGDVGRPQILDELAKLAPVRAVRGNIDAGDWADALPEHRVELVGGRRLLMLHQRAHLTPALAAGVDTVIFGHTHQPLIETHDGVLMLNPGSAGPRRFSLPITLMRLTISADGLHPRLVELG